MDYSYGLFTGWAGLRGLSENDTFWLFPKQINTFSFLYIKAKIKTPIIIYSRLLNSFIRDYHGRECRSLLSSPIIWILLNNLINNSFKYFK